MVIVGKGGLIRSRTSLIARSIVILLLFGINAAILGFISTGSSEVLAATDTLRLQELGSQKSQLQKELEALQKKATESKQQAAAEKKREKELVAGIKKLDGDITTTQKRINQTNGQINQTLGAIETQLQSIVHKEADISKKREETYETAIEYHIELSQENELDAVLVSEKVTSVMDRASALDSLSEKLIRDSEQLEQERQDLLTKKSELETQQQSLETQKNQLAAYERALNSQKEQKGKLAEQSKVAQKTHISQANEAIEVSEKLKKQFAALANEEAAIRRAASRKGKATAIRNTNPSALGFIWPVSGATITTNFGGRTPFQNFHTGLDLADAAGTPIYAAQSGVVTVATKMCCSDYSGTVDKSYGYGNWLEIKHDNGYITRYAHLMEMLVSPGTPVARGQLIAYMGGGRGMAGAGWSTGSHLHFETWDSEGPLDPLLVLP